MAECLVVGTGVMAEEVLLNLGSPTTLTANVELWRNLAAKFCQRERWFSEAPDC